MNTDIWTMNTDMMTMNTDMSANACESDLSISNRLFAQSQVYIYTAYTHIRVHDTHIQSDSGSALNSMSCSPLWRICDDLNSPKVK